MSKRNVLSVFSALFLVLMWCGYVNADAYSVNKEKAAPYVTHKVGSTPYIHKETTPYLRHKESAVGGMMTPQPAIFPAERDGKWGYMTTTGTFTIEPKYQEANAFSEGLAPVKLDGKWGFVDQSGTEVIKPQFDEAGDFRNGLVRVKQDGKWGFADKSGTWVVKPLYDSAGDFSNSLARVRLGALLTSNWAYIDKSGKIIAGTLGKEVTPGAYKEGGMATRTKFDDARDFSNGMAAVKVGGVTGKWGYINTSGSLKINARFDSAGDFSREGLANVKLNGKWGYTDRQGNLGIQPQFNKAEPFTEGLALVQTGGLLSEKYGYIDKTGKFVIDAKYENAGPFSDGLARVKQDSKWGYINPQGTFVIQPQFGDAMDFTNGVARIKTSGMITGKWQYIDKSGNLIGAVK